MSEKRIDVSIGYDKSDIPTLIDEINNKADRDYAKIVWEWMIQWQLEAANLKGKYSPYEVASWMANDWRKEEIWEK